MRLFDRASLDHRFPLTLSRESRWLSRSTLTLDAEDWEIAFEPSAGHSGSALTLAYHFMNLKEYLESETRDIFEALAAIDRAADKLYEYTDFHDVSHQLFRQTVEGTFKPDVEKKLREPGVRTWHFSNSAILLRRILHHARRGSYVQSTTLPQFLKLLHLL